MTNPTTSDVDKENKQMLQITEQLSDGRKYVHDLHSLRLPSGNYAHTIGQQDLYKELVAHGLAVEPCMGHQQLSVIYSRWLKGGPPPPARFSASGTWFKFAPSRQRCLPRFSISVFP